MWNSIVGLLTGLIRVMYGFTVSLGSPSYGLAIILFTVALRILMFPLNLIQAKSTKAMAVLQPRMQKLQQQYKNSPDILNREIQALYRKYNVNPLAGCLPMLIQMPVLIGLFSALRDFQYTGEGGSFFWMTNLSEKDPTGFVMPVIVGFSSFLQSKLSIASQPPANDQAKTMNTVMLYGMPVMLGYMTRNFASGLAIYWSIFNILGFLMQIAINAIVNRSQESLKATMEADEAKSLQETKASNEKKTSHEGKLEGARTKTETERKNTADRKQIKVNRSRGKQQESNKGKELDFGD